MQLLGSLLVNLFGWLGTYLTVRLGQKVAFWVATSAAVALAYTALLATVKGLAVVVSYQLPPAADAALSWIIPNVVPELIATRLAAQVAISIYTYQLNLRLALVAGS